METHLTEDAPMTKKDLLSELQNPKFINLHFSDMHGTTKAIRIPPDELNLEHGTAFDGSSIRGFADINTSDMVLMPDPSTAAILPWAKNEVRIISDVYMTNGEPFEGDPRNILKRNIADAANMGYTVNMAPELEFFLVDPITKRPIDQGGYFETSEDPGAPIRRAICETLQEFGMTIEGDHHEVAPGQQEINVRYEEALRAADNAATFKLVTKKIARTHGTQAIFMPKPFEGVNGSGMHTHQSLFGLESKNNVFYDADGDHKLSEIALQYIAGVLMHIPAVSAITNPDVNSWKRVVPGYEAPELISWSSMNRSALIRVPNSIDGHENSTRIEVRNPDPSANPYLAFAVMLAAGLDGIRNNMVPPKCAVGNLYQLSQSELDEMGIRGLPGSLGNALTELRRNQVIQDALGKHALEAYLEAKDAEWSSYRTHVTSLERKQYLMEPGLEI